MACSIPRQVTGHALLGDLPFFDDFASLPLDDEAVVMDVWDFTPTTSPRGSPAPFDASLFADVAQSPEVMMPLPASFRNFLSPVPCDPAKLSTSPLDLSFGSSVVWDGCPSDDFLQQMWTPPASPRLDDDDVEDLTFGTLPFGFDIIADSSDDELASLISESDVPDVPVPVSRKRRAADDLPSTEAKRVREKKPSRSNEEETSAEIAAAVAACRASGADDVETKRMTHNILERKRRNDLKDCYTLLRMQIPDLVQDDRAATGHVLMRACEFIGSLQDTENKLLSGIAAARAENARLRSVMRQ